MMITTGPEPKVRGETRTRSESIAAVTLIGAGGRGLFALVIRAAPGNPQHDEGQRPHEGDATRRLARPANVAAFRLVHTVRLQA